MLLIVFNSHYATIQTQKDAMRPTTAAATVYKGLLFSWKYNNLTKWSHLEFCNKTYP
jgi:hypothetical protein